jgi:exodeoxyribonuclease VII large subunit
MRAEKNPGDPGEMVIYKVSELTSLMKEMLEGEFPSVWVEGEISNFVRAASGHLYFSVKDERAQIPSVMFRSDTSTLDFELENGLNILARGRISIYPPSGRYQLIVSEVKPLGVGLLYLEYEKLKKQLAAEGLFDDSRKVPLPDFPGLIGVITSPKGAVIRDIISIIGRRYPLAEIVLYPVKVQGEGAAEQIARAIEEMNRWGKPDLLIVGRGGGSLEDLWAFNEEIVARSIADSKLPVVSAVGHEIDMTISDLVSDMRAPTPSAAAELVVPDAGRLRSNLEGTTNKIRREIWIILERMENRFEYLSSHHGLRRVPRMVEEAMQRVDQNQLMMKKNLVGLLQRMSRRLQELSGSLDLLSPLATLGRGYSLTYRLPEGVLVRNADTLSPGDRVRVRLHEGKIECEVMEVVN